MRTRSALTMIAVAALAALAVAALRLGWVDRLTGPAPAPPDRSLLPAERTTDDLRAVEVALPDGQLARFERRDDHWLMTAPYRAPADEYLLDRLGRSLLSLRIVRRHRPDDRDRPGDDRTGLARPRYVVRVWIGPDPPITILIGRRRPMSQQTYVLRDEQPTIYVVDNDPAAWLAPGLLRYRSDLAVRFEPDRVERLAAEGGPDWRAAREGGAWRLDDPDAGAVDPGAIGALLDRLNRIRTDEILDAPQPAAPAALTLTVALAGGESIELALARAGGRTLGRVLGRPTAFVAGPELLDELTALAEAVADR